MIKTKAMECDAVWITEIGYTRKEDIKDWKP